MSLFFTRTDPRNTSLLCVPEASVLRKHHRVGCSRVGQQCVAQRRVKRSKTRKKKKTLIRKRLRSLSSGAPDAFHWRQRLPPRRSHLKRPAASLAFRSARDFRCREKVSRSGGWYFNRPRECSEPARETMMRAARRDRAASVKKGHRGYALADGVRKEREKEGWT